MIGVVAALLLGTSAAFGLWIAASAQRSARAPHGGLDEPFTRFACRLGDVIARVDGR